MNLDKYPDLLTVEEMYEADRLTDMSCKDSLKLMNAAGTFLYREILKRYSPRRTLILCGPGNNGGDGFVLANLLHRRGWHVQILMLGDPDSLPEDARTFAKKWPFEIKKISPEEIDRAALVVDALFGAGLSRPVEGMLSDCFAKVESLSVPVVSVDIPSGVDGNTGEIRGTALRSELCVTFARAKPGHFLYPGRGLYKELVVGDIGIPDRVIKSLSPKCAINIPVAYPFAKAESHKYTRGHGLILGGSNMCGASRLAAQAARRAGAGLVTIVSPKSAYQIYRQSEIGTLVSKEPLDSHLKDSRKNAILAGPGLGLDEEARDRLKEVLSSKRALVLDADALTLLAHQGVGEGAAAFHQKDVILTPHEGEFARLFPHITGSKLDRARKAARESRAVVVLKGADCVIAAPDGQARIERHAPPNLATAGTGDVLSGIALSLLAQGLSAFEAASLAVYVHGKAALKQGEGLIAEDLADNLSCVLKDLRKQTL